MPYSNILEVEISRERIPQAVLKPRLESYDSAEEFSLDHLREVYKLVQLENHELDGYVFDDSCLRVA